MNCSIEVRRMHQCAGCGKGFGKKDTAIPIRLENNYGYSISVLCPTCMDLYKDYKAKKERLLRV